MVDNYIVKSVINHRPAFVALGKSVDLSSQATELSLGHDFAAKNMGVLQQQTGDVHKMCYSYIIKDGLGEATMVGHGVNSGVNSGLGND